MFTNEDNGFSSSSEDEIDAAALQEACDEKFLPNSLFKKKYSSATDGTTTHDITNDIKTEIKPSLRITDRSDSFETFGISQSFKDFVAKKLDDKLERNIELQNESDDNQEPVAKEKKRKKKKKKHRVNLEAGIKLLTSSQEAIINVEVPKIEKNKRTLKPWKFTKKSEAMNIAKCQDVAVDPEWILSKIETKGWNERQKGTVFKYKKGCDGVLSEQL